MKIHFASLSYRAGQRSWRLYQQQSPTTERANRYDLEEREWAGECEQVSAIERKRVRKWRRWRKNMETKNLITKTKDNETLNLNFKYFYDCCNFHALHVPFRFLWKISSRVSLDRFEWLLLGLGSPRWWGCSNIWCHVVSVCVCVYAWERERESK